MTVAPGTATPLKVTCPMCSGAAAPKRPFNAMRMATAKVSMRLVFRGLFDTRRHLGPSGVRLLAVDTRWPGLAKQTRRRGVWTLDDSRASAVRQLDTSGGRIVAFVPSDRFWDALVSFPWAS